MKVEKYTLMLGYSIIIILVILTGVTVPSNAQSPLIRVGLSSSVFSPHNLYMPLMLK